MTDLSKIELMNTEQFSYFWTKANGDSTRTYYEWVTLHTDLVNFLKTMRQHNGES